MIATFHGQQYVKLQVGDTTLAINPTSLDTDKKAHRFGANVVLVTTPVEPYSGIETASYGNANPFVIDGPGEYEVGDITVVGVAAGEGEGWMNTAYVLNWDGMKVLVIGNVTSPEQIPSNLRELAGEPDIVIVPVASLYAPTASVAYKLAQSFEPHLLMPVGEDSTALQAFMKDASGPAELVDKATLRTKEVQAKEGEVIALSTS